MGVCDDDSTSDAVTLCLSRLRSPRQRELGDESASWFWMSSGAAEDG